MKGHIYLQHDMPAPTIGNTDWESIKRLSAPAIIPTPVDVNGHFVGRAHVHAIRIPNAHEPYGCLDDCPARSTVLRQLIASCETIECMLNSGTDVALSWAIVQQDRMFGPWERMSGIERLIQASVLGLYGRHGGGSKDLTVLHYRSGSSLNAWRKRQYRKLEMTHGWKSLAQRAALL